jgi:hypothetical protein
MIGDNYYRFEQNDLELISMYIALAATYHMGQGNG